MSKNKVEILIDWFTDILNNTSCDRLASYIKHDVEWTSTSCDDFINSILIMIVVDLFRAYINANQMTDSMRTIMTLSHKLVTGQKVIKIKHTSTEYDFNIHLNNLVAEYFERKNIYYLVVIFSVYMNLISKINESEIDVQRLFNMIYNMWSVKYG